MLTKRKHLQESIWCEKVRIKLGGEDKMETREEIKCETSKIKGRLRDIMEI